MLAVVEGGGLPALQPVASPSVNFAMIAVVVVIANSVVGLLWLAGLQRFPSEIVVKLSRASAELVVVGTVVTALYVVLIVALRFASA